MTLEMWAVSFLFSFSLLWFRDEPPPPKLNEPPKRCLVIKEQKQELVLKYEECDNVSQ